MHGEFMKGLVGGGFPKSMVDVRLHGHIVPEPRVLGYWGADEKYRT